MNKYIIKINNLIKKSGFILFVLRLPFRTLSYILIHLNSLFWKFFLKECGENVTIELGVKIENPKNVIIKGNVYIGKNSTLGSENTTGQLILEENVHIGRFCQIDHTGNVTILKNTLLSANVIILSHTHGYSPKNKAIPQDLIIGENCWFGINTVISEKVAKIHNFTILATGSILTKSTTANNLIYAGIPAKKIKEYMYE